MAEQVYDVVVAGAGIVGATLALSLARLDVDQALRVALVEAREPVSPPASFFTSNNNFGARVVALNESSRQLFIKLGVWQEIVAARVCPYTRMQVRDSEGTGFIEFESAEIQRDNLGHIVENAVVQTSLYAAIARQSNIDFLCPEQIKTVIRSDKQPLSDNQARQENELQPEGGRLSLALENRLISTSLLIAADGAHSKLRQSCGFRSREWDYGHQAIVATLRGELSHQYTAWQWFMPTGPLALLPLQSQSGDSHYVSIVWSQSEPRSDSLMAMSDTAFCRELGLASEQLMGGFEMISARQCFPLRQCHAIDYVQAGIALIGDAAHSIHPLAGQGVNLGLSDVRVLTEELTRCLHHERDIGSEAVLRRYQRRRKPENLAVMAAMEGFKRLFERDEPALRFLRNVGMAQLNALAPIKNRLIKQAMGLG